MTLIVSLCLITMAVVLLNPVLMEIYQRMLQDLEISVDNISHLTQVLEAAVKTFVQLMVNSPHFQLKLEANQVVIRVQL